MWTQAEVESEIMRLSDYAEDCLDDLVRRSVAAAEAEHAYKVRYAKERLRAGMSLEGTGPGGRVTDAQRDDHSTVACDKELRERLITEAYAFSAKERSRTIQTQIDALRTIAANIRAQT